PRLVRPLPSLQEPVEKLFVGGAFSRLISRERIETIDSIETRTAMVRKKLGRGRKNRCRFCTKEGCPRPAFVAYKDVQGLKKMCTSQGKLFSRKRSGNCAAFQRAVKDAIKRARFMALLPYVGE